MTVNKRQQRKCWTCGSEKHISRFCKKDSGNGKILPRTTTSSNYKGNSCPKDNRNLSPNRGLSPPRHKGKNSFKFNSTLESAYLINSELNVNKAEWIIDTGASHNFSNDIKLFSHFEKLNKETLAVAVKDVEVPVEGKGVIKLRFGQRLLILNDVMFSPKLRRNIISGSKLDEAGYNFIGKNGEVRIYKNRNFCFKAKLKDGLYFAFPKVFKSNKNVHFDLGNTQKANSNSTGKDGLKTWHRRLAHISPSILVHTSKQKCVKGLPELTDNDFFCDNCKVGKFKRVSFKPTNNIRSSRPLELIYSDIWGPCQVEGRSGEKYFLSIIDDFSRRVAVYPLTLKSEAFDKVTSFITRAENLLDLKVKSFRSDNGAEYVNHNFEEYFKQKGIRHELTNVYTPEQNGPAERFNQTIADGTRTLLEESGLDQSFWPEAMWYFVYTWNRVCSGKKNKSPFELYTGRVPSVRHMKPFGIIAYAGVPRQRRQKLDSKAQRGVFIGYAFHTKGYRIWLNESNRIIETLNVRFNENLTYGSSQSGAVLGNDQGYFYVSDSGSDENESVEETKIERTSTKRLSESDTKSETSEDGDSDSEDDPESPTDFWERKVVTRATGRTAGRNDIYYFHKGQGERLRSMNDVKQFCRKNHLNFDPNAFDFNTSNTYSGVVGLGFDSNSTPSTNNLKLQA